VFYIKCAAIFAAAFCYGIVCDIPKKHLAFSGLTACIGYAVYLMFLPNEIIGCFIGSCCIALMGELLSRILKETATVFIIPGIIPLVPGAKMYSMTLAFLTRDFEQGIVLGGSVIMYAGCIALAILLVSSTVRSFSKFFSR